MTNHCNCYPHGPDQPCTCDGCGGCSGHEIGCTCDIDWECTVSNPCAARAASESNQQLIQQGETMTASTTTAADTFLMGGGAASAKFETPGDTTTGTIAEAPEVRQMTDIKTGDPVYWPSGDPKMQLVVTLQTNHRDDDEDDGKRRIYIKGKSLTEAVREAVKTAGAKGLEIGGTLTVTYTGDGPVTTRGFNPPKLYTASYGRPDTTATSGAFLGVTPETGYGRAGGPAPAPSPTPAGPTPEQVAALKAAGIDPRTVFPTYQG